MNREAGSPNPNVLGRTGFVYKVNCFPNIVNVATKVFDANNHRRPIGQ
jgi:hypothetical protein